MRIGKKSREEREEKKGEEGQGGRKEGEEGNCTTDGSVTCCRPQRRRYARRALPFISMPASTCAFSWSHPRLLTISTASAGSCARGCLHKPKTSRWGPGGDTQDAVSLKYWPSLSTSHFHYPRASARVARCSLAYCWLLVTSQTQGTSQTVVLLSGLYWQHRWK